MARKPTDSSTRAGTRRGRASQAALETSGKPRRGRPPGKKLVAEDEAPSRATRPASRQQTLAGRAAKRSASRAGGPVRARPQDTEPALAAETQLLLNGLRSLESAIEALGARLESLLRQSSAEGDPSNALPRAEPASTDTGVVPQQRESQTSDETEAAELVPSD